MRTLKVEKCVECPWHSSFERLDEGIQEFYCSNPKLTLNKTNSVEISFEALRDNFPPACPAKKPDPVDWEKSYSEVERCCNELEVALVEKNEEIRELKEDVVQWKTECLYWKDYALKFRTLYNDTKEQHIKLNEKYSKLKSGSLWSKLWKKIK
jgi:hypothetical protein